MIRVVFIILLIIVTIGISCKKEVDSVALPPAEGSVEIKTCKVQDTSSISCTVAISLKNVAKVSFRFKLYDENMQLIDSTYPKVLRTQSYTEQINGLKRGMKYKIRSCIYSDSLSRVESNTLEFKTHSFTITGMTHQNSMQSFEVNGVRPNEMIYIEGKYLDEYNDDCSVLLGGLDGMVNIIAKTKECLTLSVKKDINEEFSNKNYIKYPIIVKEKEDTISSTFSINVFTDKPSLTGRVDVVVSSSFFEAYGFFGNFREFGNGGGVDSAFIGGIKCELAGVGVNRSYYYHQVGNQYLRLTNGLSPGTYQLRVYLNGYEAKLDGIAVK